MCAVPLEYNTTCTIRENNHDAREYTVSLGILKLMLTLMLLPMLKLMLMLILILMLMRLLGEVDVDVRCVMSNPRCAVCDVRRATCDVQCGCVM